MRAVTVYNGELVAGGAFWQAGGASRFRIARWNGTTWQSLGSGIAGNTVFALATRNGELIAGGDMSAAGCYGIARWNGTIWQALGSGLNEAAYTLAVYNGDLIAGGGFNTAGGVTCNRVAHWNGSAWQALGPGMDNSVAALAAYSGTLVAGGYFLSAGNTACSHVAQWGGSVWQPLASGTAPDSGVSAMAGYGGEMIVGGRFQAVGGALRNGIARWNGSTWQSLGSGMGYYPYGPGSVMALTGYNSDLIAGGEFTTAGGVSCSNIARWNGTVWQPLGTGIYGSWVAALAVYDGDLIVGGAFSQAGGVPCSQIASWDGTVWKALGLGMTPDPNDPYGTVVVLAMAIYDGDLIAAGQFTRAGGVPCDHIARFDGSAWGPLGSGMHIDPYYGSASVSALMVYNGELIAGGYFTTAGGQTCVCIARWNGTSWQPVGEGVNNAVYAFTTYGGDLIAGGHFTLAGSAACNGIATWNGETWQPLGSGMGGQLPSVDALSVYDNKLIVGGQFGTAGGQVACNWARWACSAPEITQQPVPLTISAGQPAVFTVTAAGSGTLTYQWRRGGVALANAGRISGATTATLTLSPACIGDAANYDVVVSNAYGSVDSATAALTVSPGGATDCNGNGEADACDIASGTSLDANSNGVPDECEICTRNELAMVLPSTPGRTMFAAALDMDGDRAIIGAVYDSALGYNAGAAYIFRFDGTRWVQEAKLLASDGLAYDNFAYAVALSGPVAVVGAHGVDDLGDLAGAAYVFRFNGTAWVQEAKLHASDGAAGDIFGCHVMVDANTVVIGAGYDDTVAVDTGSAYVFEFDGIGWSQRAKLVAPDAAVYDNFGWAIGLDGDWLLVGAHAANDYGSDSGSVYAFHRSAGVWNYFSELHPSDAGSGDIFGVTIALNGLRAAIGAYRNDDQGENSGAAYVFEYDGAAWVERTTLLPPDGAAGDTFGRAVALSGDFVVAGAPWHDVQDPNDGAAYVFRKLGNAWVCQAELVASNGAAGDLFAYAVGLAEGRAIVGAFEADAQGNESGAAYAFGGISDCDNDLVLDLCATAAAWRPDCNATGVPDGCETIGSGDFNANGRVDSGDFTALADVLAGPGATPSVSPPTCLSTYLAAFDFNTDNDVDFADFAQFQRVFSGS